MNEKIQIRHNNVSNQVTKIVLIWNARSLTYTDTIIINSVGKMIHMLTAKNIP